MKRKDDLYMREQLSRACRTHQSHSDVIHDTALLDVAIKYFKSVYTVDTYKNANTGGDNKFLVNVIHKGLKQIKTHSTKSTSGTIGWLLYIGVTHTMDELDGALDSLFR